MTLRKMGMGEILTTESEENSPISSQAALSGRVWTPVDDEELAEESSLEG